MEFREYVKGDRTIHATETAYKVIYQAQGFVPKGEEKKEPPPGTEVTPEGEENKEPPGTEVTPDAGAKSDAAGGGDGGHNGEGASAGKSKKSK